MNISATLNDLIRTSLVDGKISTKEKSVLLKKAIEEGLDKEEFELYLTSLVQKKKSKKEKNNFIIAVIVLVIIAAGFYFLYPYLKKESDKPTLSVKSFCSSKLSVNKSNLTEKHGCNGVDDCLSKYNFEAARAFMAAEEESGEGGVSKHLDKIISAESVFNAKQGDFQRGLDVINEANYNQFEEGNRERARYVILGMAVDYYLDKHDIQSAKIWALKASNLRNIEGYTEREIYGWKASETQQKILLKKINDYQETIK